MRQHRTQLAMASSSAVQVEGPSLSALLCDTLSRILLHNGPCTIARLAAAAKHFKWCESAPCLWMMLCVARWPGTAHPAMRRALQRRGERAFYQSRLLAELGNVGTTGSFPLRRWLVTLEMWQGQRLVHSSAHEAQELFGEYNSADDLFVHGFNFDLRSQPIIWEGHCRPDPEALEWDIAVSVVRKDDGAIAPLIRRVRVGDVLSGYLGSDFACSMVVENIITKNRPFGDVNLFIRNRPYIVETMLHIVETKNSTCPVVSRTVSGTELHFLLLSFELCRLGWAEEAPSNEEEHPYIDWTPNDLQEMLHAHLIFHVNS